MNNKKNHYSNFLESLKAASAEIKQDYFQVEFYGSPDLKYRERIFCYELYHQMRIKLGNEFEYKLHGEMDKKTHVEYIKDEDLKNSIPDFIVHRQGGMTNNLVAMEVKHVKSALTNILNDIDKLKKFVRIGRYYKGILLIYGNLGEDEFNKIYYSIDENVELVLIDQAGHFCHITKSV